MANAPSDPSSGPTTSSGRPPRLPRWTRQEILVLIEGKRMVERRGRGRVGPGGLGQPGPLEPKWAAVSAYCKRHGVNRGPVQCRKRWSNLAGDYKKIKEWERGGGGGAGSGKNESFWGMRNDLRREKRLPGFFDREVYDILDGGIGGVGGGGGSRIEMEDDDDDDDEEHKDKDKVDRDVEEDQKLGVEGDHDQARVSDHSTGKKGGLFDDDEEEEVDQERSRGGSEKADVPVATLVTCAVPISEVRCAEPLHPGSSEPGTSREKQPSDVDREKDVPSQEGHKRRRTAEGEREEADHHAQLLQVLERNSRMVAAQLEAQNINLQLDRDQRREQTNSLLGVLNRLADSLSKIADKL